MGRTAKEAVRLAAFPLYESIVKTKWAVNSTFMSLCAFAVVLIYWVLHSYDMVFDNKLLPLWAKGAPTLGQKFLIKQARIQKTTGVSQEQKKQFGRIEEVD